MRREIKQTVKAQGSLDLGPLGRLVKTKNEDSFTYHPAKKPLVFIGYAHEDADVATRLFEYLKRHGVAPWIDKRRLVPGQNWPLAIEQAIGAADYAVMLFSSKVLQKRSYFHRELRMVLDASRDFPLGRGFIIPVRLDPCELPGEVRHSSQWVDFFPDEALGIEQICRVVCRG